MKYKKYHTTGTIAKSDKKNRRKRQNRSSNTQIQDSSLSLHGTDPPIKSLNRDSQQFHQKYISPQIIEQKKTTTYEVVNPGPDLGQAPKCAKSENIINSTKQKQQ